MSFGERLKQKRLEKKFSQGKLAELTDLHYTQIGRYERGDSKPTSGVLKRLADVLEVTTDYLMEGTTEDIAQSHLHDRELLRQFQQVELLNENDRNVVKTLIDAFIQKRTIQEIMKKDKIPA